MSVLRIEGYVIISADGMLANSDRVMPDALKFEGDQSFFNAALDSADLIVPRAEFVRGSTKLPTQVAYCSDACDCCTGPRSGKSKGNVMESGGRIVSASVRAGWDSLGNGGDHRRPVGVCHVSSAVMIRFGFHKRRLFTCRTASRVSRRSATFTGRTLQASGLQARDKRVPMRNSTSPSPHAKGRVIVRQR